MAKAGLDEEYRRYPVGPIRLRAIIVHRPVGRQRGYGNVNGNGNGHASANANPPQGVSTIHHRSYSRTQLGERERNGLGSQQEGPRREKDWKGIERENWAPSGSLTCPAHRPRQSSAEPRQASISPAAPTEKRPLRAGEGPCPTLVTHPLSGSTAA